MNTRPMMCQTVFRHQDKRLKQVSLRTFSNEVAIQRVQWVPGGAATGTAPRPRRRPTRWRPFLRSSASRLPSSLVAAARSLLLRVGRRSMRRDPKPNPTSRCRTIPTKSFALHQFMRPAHAASLITKLPRSAGAQVAVTISTADPAIDQNPAKTDVQSASGFLAPTPVSPDCRTNLR